MSFLRASIQEVIQWLISGKQLNAAHILPILVEAVHVNGLNCAIYTLIFQSLEVRLHMCPDKEDAMLIAMLVVSMLTTYASTHPWNGFDSNKNFGS